MQKITKENAARDMEIATTALIGALENSNNLSDVVNKILMFKMGYTAGVLFTTKDLELSLSLMNTSEKEMKLDLTNLKKNLKND